MGGKQWKEKRYFSLLSYFPPKSPLFKDPNTGGHGIVEHDH